MHTKVVSRCKSTSKSKNHFHVKHSLAPYKASDFELGTRYSQFVNAPYRAFSSILILLRLSFIFTSLVNNPR